MTATQSAAKDSYSANLNIDGAQVGVTATSIHALVHYVLQLGAYDEDALMQTLADHDLVDLSGDHLERQRKWEETLEALERNSKAALIVSPPAAQKSVKAEQPKEAPGKPASAPPAVEPAPVAPPAAVSTPAQAVSYEDVKARVNKLYAVTPEHALDALAKFGAKKGPELQPTQWAEFVAHADAQLAALGA